MVAISTRVGPGSRLGELVAETETRSAVFVARRPSVRARIREWPLALLTTLLHGGW